MQVGVLGISYQSSDMRTRELFVQTVQELLGEKIFSLWGLDVVLLSTCNRTEIYFSVEDLELAEAHSVIMTELRKKRGDLFSHPLYSHFAEDCFFHLVKVTSGVDSVIFGEAEIQRQVKEAYERASSSTAPRKLSFALHYLFQKSLKIGKEIRTEFSLPRGQITMESTIERILLYFFGDSCKKDISLLFIGNSEINRNVLFFLQEKGFSRLSLASKHPIQDPEIHGVSWLEVGRWTEYDGVIAGSHVTDFLLQYEKKLYMQNRLILDLGFPRNVDPALDHHPATTLLDLEDLNAFIGCREQGVLAEKDLIQTKIEELTLHQSAIYREKRKKIFVCA